MINVSETDSVEAVMDLTDGKGADVVVECVGGFAGVKSFEAAQRMVKSDGVIHLIALYQGQALSLGHQPVRGQAHHRRLLQVYVAGRAVEKGYEGHPGRTHKRPDPSPPTGCRGKKTPDAYHLLYNNPDEALGVILEWD